MSWIYLIISISFFIISIYEACDHLALVKVRENIPYPSPSLIDVFSILPVAQATSDGDKDSMYLIDLAGSKPFTLNNGKLSVTGPLDREQICNNENSEQRKSVSKCCPSMCCMFVGIMTALGKTVYIKIIIEDENDNEPSFPQSTIKKQLHENNELGHKIDLPKAVDSDSADYGLDRYEVLQDKTCPDCFQVMSETRDLSPTLVLKTRLDREVNSVFNLQILAIDKGVPAKSTSLSVIIEVLDINDNSPLFEENSIVISVEENGRSGREIRNLKVTDADTGVNEQISYLIEDYTSTAQKHFRLYSIKNGVSLLLQSTLDFESIPNTFQFKIVAKDHGVPSLSSTATVNILVTNVNDERPEIFFYQRGLALDPNNIMLHLPENGPKQKTIVSVHVTDKDSKPADISCDVSSPKDVFYLHENQHTNMVEKKKLFDLQNAVLFDRETTNQYRISITCYDSNTVEKLTHTVEIQLRITDENDNPPVFSSGLYFGKIVETNSLDKVVDLKDSLIKVTDADIDLNSRIKYSLADIGNSTDSHKFSITPHYPHIKNIVPIDFEEKKQYVFVIIAKDGGSPVLSASATITVKVLDANDNRPEISQKFYSFTVLEEEPIGTEIGKIDATDADLEPGNRDFIYEIVNHDGSKSDTRPNKLFMIENNTGKIKTRVALDHEKDQNINFLVRVKNTNEDSRSREMLDFYGGSVSVNVKIEDINDNSPKLAYKDTSSSSEFVNTEVLKRPVISINNEQHSTSNPCALFPFTFTDADEGLNSEVRVSLVSNSNFQLDMGHNLICPKHPNIAAGSYSVYVVGEDRNGGNGSRKSEYMINIVVKSSNINKPHNPRKSPRLDQEEKLNDYKAVIIFIVLIATIILFCFLLIVVVVKTKLCIPRNSSLQSRSRDKVVDKQDSSSTNKNYNVIIPGGNGENKRLCGDYQRSSLNNQNQMNSDYSNNIFFSRSDTPNMDLLNNQYSNQITLPKFSQSCEFMFQELGENGPGSNQEHTSRRDVRYEQLMRTNGQDQPGNMANWDKIQGHQYNYLLEPRDSGSLPSDCGKSTAPKQDMITVGAGYQKSINDVYLQTSFV